MPPRRLWRAALGRLVAGSAHLLAWLGREGEGGLARGARGHCVCMGRSSLARGSPTLREGAARAVLGSPLRSGAAWVRDVLRYGRGAQQPQAGRRARAQSSRRRRSSLGSWRQSSGGPFRAPGRLCAPPQCAPSPSLAAPSLRSSLLLAPPSARARLPARVCTVPPPSATDTPDPSPSLSALRA